jgi:hypothetical protein
MLYKIGIIVLLLICFIYGSFWSWNGIKRQQEGINSSYEAIDDMKKCPNTAKFMVNIQTGFTTVNFAVLVTCLSGLFFMFFLLLLYFSENTRQIAEYGFIYMIITVLAVFISVYKISNCIIFRMCALKSCDDKFYN